MNYKKDYEDAAAFRDFIHKEALKKIHLQYPEIARVIDHHPIEDYISQYWDYPGAWYTHIAIPEGYKSRDDCINSLVRDTINNTKTFR